LLFSDQEKSCSLRQAQTAHGHISRLTRWRSPDEAHCIEANRCQKRIRACLCGRFERNLAWRLLARSSSPAVGDTAELRQVLDVVHAREVYVDEIEKSGIVSGRLLLASKLSR
jgi:hypothetical protein